jgi:peptidoglycan-N-acetylglucosamine deacetylase
MVGNRLAGVWIGCSIAFCLAFFACSAANAEPAAADNNCPGHPDAIGTERTLVVDPRAHPRIGSMQYPETLPLRDHEVVLSFDDGPLPRNSNQVLQILADNCVKATFFEVGEMAQAFPDGIRKLVAAGHTVGSHSQHHPLTFHKMTEQQAQQEVDQGIASIKAAMTDPSALAPFFRIPGLLRAEPVEAYLESQGIQTWSTDTLADDWRHISSAQVYALAMKRLDAMGKGILLLHDIQPRTVAALPKILHDLKAQGFHIVHVVPSTPDLPPTPTDPEQWQVHPTSEDVAITRWQKLPNFVFEESDTMPVPDASSFDLAQANLAIDLDPAEHASRRGSSLAETAWPRVENLPVVDTAVSMPIPAATLFEIPEQARDVVQPFPTHMHHFDQPVVAEGGETAHSSAPASEPRYRRGRHGRLVRVAHAAHPAAAARDHVAARHAAAHQAVAHQAAHPAAKRTVHYASLKKRKI